MEVATYINYDPTRTTSLRNLFAKDMHRRFAELIRVITESIVTQDCFGLTHKAISTFQVAPTGSGAFMFMRDPEKVEAFMRWLKIQEEKGLLTIGQFEQIGRAVNEAWTNRYIFDSYKRGVIRARYELQKAGVPSLDDTGGIDAVMGTPFHMDRIGLLFTRVFSQLQGITAAMDTNISQILAQGMIDGDGPALIARKLVAAINGTGLGDLGITDKLGRFIPAEVRAVMLARTEIIRAFHLAAIQEYRNWAVLEIYVQAEWMTAGDDRVCPECAKMEYNADGTRRLFTLDEIEPLIPKHPNCLIDTQTPIYTSEGWKPIGKVKIGDYVLTHERRFRKVYALPRHKEKAEVITIKFESDLQLTLTTNHQVLLTTKDRKLSRWTELGNIKEGDCLSLLGNECKRCKKPIPYFRKYCSHSCLSKDITDRQWSNPEHRKNMSEKASKQLYKAYINGKRNGKEITKEAHKKMQELADKGKHPFQQKDVQAKMIIATHTPELNKRHSERMKKNNPMSDLIIVEKAKNSMEIFYRNNPERRLNVLMAKHRKSSNMTSIEKKMKEILDRLRIEYIYQYPILRYDVDFAIPSLRIVIECDGLYWHKDKEKDLIRDKNIENEGWFILHYTDEKINKCFNEIETELARVLCNHLGEYALVGYQVKEIKRWILQKKRTLYNLSVEEDESYIAKGVVVHNCRCIALPYLEELRPYYSNKHEYKIGGN